ncbi:protein PAXX-like [Glandiceps talaboti]
MSSAKQLAIEAEVDTLHATVNSGSGKLLCFTSCARHGDTWTLHVTDGIDVWRLELDKTELDSHRELSNINNMTAFLNKIKSAFESGDLNISLQGHTTTLTAGKGATALTFDLYEASASKRKTDLQNVLMRLADLATMLNTELKKTKDDLDTANKHKGSGSSSVAAFYDPSATQKTGQKIPKKKGRSLLNPDSKRVKVAKGVNFDED